ncbi:MAG: NAD(P)-binding domain-containing protein [Ignavibacteriales bacterium]|nr:NAD(P)-binding domain-containing protein [Ignavibacteriales bacterium]
MNIGIFGTGGVARAIAAKLVSLGHSVKLGTRNVDETKNRSQKDAMGNPPFQEWLEKNPSVTVGTFAEAAAFGEILMNAASGSGSLPALAAAGDTAMNGKILIDISNPLDFSKGFPPSLTVSNTDSLGEQIQRAHPSVKVVKAFNTLSNPLMVDPQLVNGGDHTLPICGNDADAKQKVTSLLNSFGWKSENILDLGDITNARGMEAFLLLWVRMYGSFKTPLFQFKIVK